MWCGRVTGLWRTQTEKVLHVARRNGEKYMEATAGSFRRSALKLSVAATDGSAQNYQVYEIPAPFCVLSYINDPRYLPVDLHSMQTCRMRKREKNKGSRAADVKSRKDDRKQRALHVVTLRNIRVGEKLIVDYGMKYWSELSSTRELHRNRIKKKLRSLSA